MKFTIDTVNKTITLHGSFKFEELVDMRRGLHPNWLDYTLTIDNYTGTQNSIVWTWNYGTNDPFSPPFTTTCGTTGQSKLNFDN